MVLLRIIFVEESECRTKSVTKRKPSAIIRGLFYLLELKYLTPDDEHIMGIEYYQAVIADDVKTYPEFIQWRKEHPANGIVSWCP